MASVFLSYDHSDADRAAPIAAALEKAGHLVWWDRHIHVGAEYNSEIEGAVERSDAVVVLWSKHSVRSAWVRDEAAEGRDQGKLVPVLIDAVKPPMGFRQYQTIDLTQRKGRRRSPVHADLIRAIEAFGGSGNHLSTKFPLIAARTPGASVLLLSGLLMVALVGLALLWWQPWTSTTPRVSVVANDDSPASRSLAGTLFVQLGSLQATNADALQLVEPESSGEADFVFKVAPVRGSQDPGASLSLIDNRSNSLLWSREFVQPGGVEADLRQQIAYSAGQVLRCTTEAFAPDHPKLKLPTLKLYLNGCADFSDLSAQHSQSAISTFKKVTEQAPKFAGGWAKLILSELIAYQKSHMKDASLRRDLRAHINQARKVDPGMADTYLAECWFQAPRPIITWMKLADEAVARDPGHAEALINRATGLIHVGRMREAVDDARRAAQAEPLYPAARFALVETLMSAGLIDAAKDELAEAGRLWPGATRLHSAQFLLEYRYGDPNEAMRILRSGQLDFTPTATQKSFLEARIDPSPAKVERAITDARNAYRTGDESLAVYVQTLMQFGRDAETMQALLTADPKANPGVIYALFRPQFSTLNHDPRFMEIARRYELIPYWRETGKWPDFCSDPNLSYDCKKEAARPPG